MSRRHNFTQVQLVFDLFDEFASKRWEKEIATRPFGSIRFLVQKNIVNDDFRNAIRLIVKQNSTGYYLFFGDIRLPDGTRRQRYLEGNTEIYIVSSFYQTEIVQVDLPVKKPTDSDYPESIIKPLQVYLKPGSAYPFPRIPQQDGPTVLRGHVVHEVPRNPSDPVVEENGERPLLRGVAGVEVSVEIDNQKYTYSLTDRTGQWLFILPDDLPVQEITIPFVMKKGETEKDDEKKIEIHKGKNNRITSPLLWS